MYCSACGVAIADGLSFCNYCGAKLNRGDDRKSPDVKPGMLVPAMVFVFVFGLVAITMMLGVMKAELQFTPGQLMAFAALGFSILMLLEGVFIRLLFRRQRNDSERSVNARKTNELDAAHARVLPEGMPSVTEHTTRAFETARRFDSGDA